MKVIRIEESAHLLHKTINRIQVDVDRANRVHMKGTLLTPHGVVDAYAWPSPQHERRKTMMRYVINFDLVINGRHYSRRLWIRGTPTRMGLSVIAGKFASGAAKREKDLEAERWRAAEEAKKEISVVKERWFPGLLKASSGKIKNIMKRK